MKIVSNKTYQELLELRAMNQRLAEAHRYLSMFDWLLEPFWEFMRGEKYIPYARAQMHGALARKLDDMARQLEERGY